MKKYKLAGEDEHTFHVQHPDGSIFPIAKNAVGPGVHKQIKALEPLKMADGGEVPDVSEDTSDDSSQDSSIAPLDVEPAPEIDEQRAPAQVQVQEPLDIQPADQIQPVIPSNNAAIANQSESAPTSLNDAYANAFAQKESGIKDVAAAQAQASQEQAKAFEAQANQVAETQKQYQQHYAQLDAEHKQLTDAFLNEKVDPNRMWHNMGTGNKVLAAIGIALSGIGSGLTGQPNMAMQVVQKSIDRDIEAQRMDLGKKQTLLSENLRRFGDLNTATQATMLQMNALTQAKVSQIAARAGSAQAQAQAKVMLGDLGLQSAQIKQQMALNMAKAKSLGYGSGEGGIPVGQEPYQLLSDPKYQEKRVLVNGRAYQHTGSAADAQNFRNVESVAGGVTDLVKQLDALGPSATVPGTLENNKAQAIRYQLSTEIPKLKSMQIGAKRVNETEAERAEKMISDPTKFSQLVNGGARNQIFFKTIEDELERARRDNLIGYKGKAQYKTFKPGV